jgi:hypothetical protein
MTYALLDHPWPLDAALDRDSPGFAVLLTFSHIVARHGLIPVPFVSEEEFANACARLNYRHSGIAAWVRFAHLCVRSPEQAGQSWAIPLPEPDPPPTHTWRLGLRDQLTDLNDWRRPEILVPQPRSACWQPHRDETEIRCSDREETVFRSLIPLEQYESHPHALCDKDPWRHLERRWSPGPGDKVHPCVLPRPPSLNDVRVRDLARRLPEAHQAGWEAPGRFYYIPPVGYDPTRVTQAQWRSGKAFPRKRHTNKRAGPVDYLGNIWAWDEKERHWDVQLEVGYMRVSHTGVEL